MTVSKEGMQNLRGTDAEFKSAGYTLKEGEIGYVTDKRKL